MRLSAGWLWAATALILACVLGADAELIRRRRESMSTYAGNRPWLLLVISGFCVVLPMHLSSRPRFLAKLDPFAFVARKLR